MVRTIPLLAAAALMLAACGTNPQDRTVSGAGIGAAGGAVIGAVTGLTVLEGAALGAVGGALTGALTDPDKLNFGEPFWRRSSRSNSASANKERVNWPGQAAAGGSELVTRVQAGLIQQGYDPGPPDGVMGPRTAQAIRAYQSANGLESDGQATLALARHLEARSN